MFGYSETVKEKYSINDLDGLEKTKPIGLRDQAEMKYGVTTVEHVFRIIDAWFHTWSLLVVCIYSLAITNLKRMVEHEYPQF